MRAATIAYAHDEVYSLQFNEDEDNLEHILKREMESPNMNQWVTLELSDSKSVSINLANVKYIEWQDV